MILVTVNKPKHLILLSFIGHVRVEELTRGRQDLISILAELSPGFRLVTDLSDLGFISNDCIEELSKAMDLCNKNGVGLVVRVVPDPAKDIGLNILSAFHYSHGQRIVTCRSMIEAAQALSL